jgi:CheY-like chemotaxis protein
VRILVCDDAAPVRKTLARALLLDGRTIVTEARSAEEALDLLALTPFDVVVMDHNLPGMTGADAVRALRRAGDTVPIVMLTGNNSGTDPLDGLVDEHLIKGHVSLVEVVAVIRHVARAAKRPAQAHKR